MKGILALGCLIICWSCSPNPYKSTNKAYKKQVKAFSRLLREYPVKDSVGLPYATDWVGTTNFGMRRPNFVIIHHTAQNSCEQTLKTFTMPQTQVSAHYLICKDGTVFHMLNDLLRAHHAGLARWGNNTDINSSSIGIELDNNGSELFTQEQETALITLLGRLKRAYNLPAANFIGHSDIAPGRKVDPSRFFSWQTLAANGFGLWYDTTAVEVPVDFDVFSALRIVGYNTQNPETAIAAFKLHYIPSDSSRLINETDKKILFSLQQQSR